MKNGKNGHAQRKGPSAKQKAELIYDWNLGDGSEPFLRRPFFLVDESLRDGVQSPSVTDPNIEDKLRILQLMEDLGIGRVDIGLPGAGKRAYDDVLALARYIKEKKLRIKPYCAARTLPP